MLWLTELVLESDLEYTHTQMVDHIAPSWFLLHVERNVDEATGIDMDYEMIFPGCLYLHQHYPLGTCLRTRNFNHIYRNFKNHRSGCTTNVI